VELTLVSCGGWLDAGDLVFARSGRNFCTVSVNYLPDWKDKEVLFGVTLFYFPAQISTWLVLVDLQFVFLKSNSLKSRMLVPQ